MKAQEWVLTDFMQTLGFEPMDADNFSGYYKYGNKAFMITKDYGPMPRHKRIIYFNCNYYKATDQLTGVYCSIAEDGGTRTVFAGVVTSQEQLKMLLDMVR